MENNEKRISHKIPNLRLLTIFLRDLRKYFSENLLDNRDSRIHHYFVCSVTYKVQQKRKSQYVIVNTLNAIYSIQRYIGYIVCFWLEELLNKDKNITGERTCQWKTPSIEKQISQPMLSFIVNKVFVKNFDVGSVVVVVVALVIIIVCCFLFYLKIRLLRFFMHHKCSCA